MPSKKGWTVVDKRGRMVDLRKEGNDQVSDYAFRVHKGDARELIVNKGERVVPAVLSWEEEKEK